MEGRFGKRKSAKRKPKSNESRAEQNGDALDELFLKFRSILFQIKAREQQNFFLETENAQMRVCRSQKSPLLETSQESLSFSGRSFSDQRKSEKPKINLSFGSPRKEKPPLFFMQEKRLVAQNNADIAKLTRETAAVTKEISRIETFSKEFTDKSNRLRMNVEALGKTHRKLLKNNYEEERMREALLDLKRQNQEMIAVLEILLPRCKESEQKMKTKEGDEFIEDFYKKQNELTNHLMWDKELCKIMRPDFATLKLQESYLKELQAMESEENENAYNEEDQEYHREYQNDMAEDYRIVYEDTNSYDNDAEVDDD